MKGFKVNKHSDRANSYCGPAALSAITGKTVEEVCGILHSNSYDPTKPIKGMHRWVMEQALGLMGFYPEPIRVKDFSRDPLGTDPTLAGWLRRPRDPKDVYLMSITGHYIVVRGRKIVDNHHPNGVFLRRYPHRRARVRWVRKVRKIVPVKAKAPSTAFAGRPS